MHLHEKTHLYTFITGLIVLTLLLGIFIISIVRQQKSRIRFYKLQVVRDMQLIEEERQRIAQDLHDDLGAILATVSMGLESIQLIIPKEKIVKDTLRNLSHSLERIRLLSHNLVPQTLNESGLAAAIEELLIDLNSDRLQCSFVKRGQDQDFIPSKALILFRVVEEILTNAVKHSSADKLKVQLFIENRVLYLGIADNGKGFDTKHINSSSSFGLSNIRSRLNLLAAVYTLESSQGKGTSYHIQIPTHSLT